MNSVARLRRAICGLALMGAIPACVDAQAGRITGAVTDTRGGALAGANVIVSAASLAAETGSDGTYSITGVPAGTYDVVVYRIGFKLARATVVVAAGQALTLGFSLEPAAVQLGGVVISAERRVQKITDAPAAVVSVSDAALAASAGTSFTPALKNIPGIDFIQTGLTTATINARGFNASSNSRMLQTEDDRIATLAESGFPAGVVTSIPKIDLERVEVLTGPASALYGPNASNGVITLTTKDPKAYPGYAVDISGGSRRFFDGQARWAGVTPNGKWGFKLDGESESAMEYAFTPSYQNPGGAARPPVPELGTNFNSSVVRGNGLIARYFRDGARLAVDAGASASYGVGQTNVGRNQVVNYGYRHLQLKYTGARWFAQAYENSSTTGGTFQLNGYSTTSFSRPALSSDSVKTLSAFPGEGRILAIEAQNNFSVASLGTTGSNVIDQTHVIWGVQYRQDRVSSYQHWLSDRVTGNAVGLTQKGAYLQVETPFTPQIRTVIAARYDEPDNYATQFSPKAAVLFSPVPDQTFRVTYARAFKSPTILMTDFYFPNFAPNVGVFGNTTGFDVKNAAGALLASYGPMQAETNNSWELGYKGVIGNALFVDATAWQARYQNFQSPLVQIANPFQNSVAYYHTTGKKVTDPSGAPQVVLIYTNLGKATIGGIDAGIKYLFSDNVSGWGNVSVLKVDTIQTTNAEATAVNSSSARVNLGMDFANVAPRTGAGFSMRYVNRYSFQSGVNVGIIPSFASLDLTASYRLPGGGATITLNAQNLFSCVGGTSRQPATGVATGVKAIYTVGQACGFGQAHQEMINMPAIGPLVFLGVRWEGR
jgi:outer membrane receptor for ferrienterochelin and colicins